MELLITTGPDFNDSETPFKDIRDFELTRMNADEKADLIRVYLRSSASFIPDRRAARGVKHA